MRRRYTDAEGPVRRQTPPDSTAGLAMFNPETPAPPPAVPMERVGRRSGTQREAEIEISDEAPSVAWRMLEHLRGIYPTGCTRPELALALGVKVNTINGRAAELLGVGSPAVVQTCGTRDGCDVLVAPRSHPLSITEVLRAVKAQKAARREARP